jgi:ABC-2 type transport system permease protein
VTAVTEILRSRELLANLTLRELRGKYKRTALGWGWSLLNPISSMLVYTFVFAVVFHATVPKGAAGVQSFPLFLLCGLLPWTFFSNSLTAGMDALVSNAHLIKKTYFPRELLVMSMVGSFGVSFLIELSVLALAFLAYGSFAVPWLLLSLIAVAVLAVFSTGIALALSVLNAYFRDLGHFIAIALQLWFYATPIVYSYEYLTNRLQHAHPRILEIYRLNPMVEFVNAFRALLYEHRFPSLASIGYLVLISIVALLLGGMIFRRLQARLAEEL